MVVGVKLLSIQGGGYILTGVWGRGSIKSI